MLVIRRIVQALALQALAGATLWGASAAELRFDGETNMPPVAAEMRHEEGPGLLPADRAYVIAGTNKFAFLIPPGLKLETWSQHLVALVTRDYSCQITFRLAGPLPADASEVSADVYRARLLEEFPGARILKSFSAIADSHRGPAYEADLPGSAGSWRRGLIAYIPSRTAVLEFCLNCVPEKFEAARQQLSTVMLTFRSSDENGQLHISPLSDKL
jgi:hypothetical protein